VPCGPGCGNNANRLMAVSETRFVALDAWRGMCALLVAMFHLQAYSHIYDSNLVRHSYLFVDFFFVLSGFVITASYRTKLLSGFSFWHFMLLRLGRLYPLHIAILVTFIAIEILRYRYSGLLGGSDDKFTGAHSLEAIITNVLLIQSLGVHKMLTWNLPSWSISVEFYTYAVFAIALLLMRIRIGIFVALVVLVAPILLLRFVGQIDTDYDFGFVRCLLGFFLGFACYDLYLLIQQREGWWKNNSPTMSLIEVFTVGVVILFVCFCGSGPVSVAAPFVFGLAVIIFSLESGGVSKILKLWPFVFLGALSYSIYMVHTLVLMAMAYACQLTEREFGITLRRAGYFGTELWQGDLYYGALIALVVGTAYLTYRFLEQPGRRHSRTFANRIFGKSGPSILAPMGSRYLENSSLDGNDGQRKLRVAP
jgi:peptidoglycan/LPS O-acetylase OafA/YrhL